MVRVRLRYSKTGPIRYTSHKDIIRVFQRCFAASDLPVCYSQGYNPHPRISFGPSLRTGWESLDEYMDVQLEQRVDRLEQRCNPKLPDGLRIIASEPVDEGVPKLAADVEAVRYEMVLSGMAAFTYDGEGGGAEGRDTGTGGRIGGLEEKLLEQFSGAGERMTGSPAAPELIEANVRGENGAVRIEYVSTMRGGRCLNPEDLLTPYFGHPDSFEIPIKVVRKSLYVRRRGCLVSPISKGVVRHL